MVQDVTPLIATFALCHYRKLLNLKTNQEGGMSVHLSPRVPFSPPPPPPYSSTPSDLPMLYYALVVAGTSIIVLILYNLIVIRLCGDIHDNQPHNLRIHRVARERTLPGPELEQLEPGQLLYSLRYHKDGPVAQDECAVSLSVFEEDEELKQMPKCNHSFHAPCIDMWLHSHMDCPLCRSPVEPPHGPQQTVVDEHPVEHFREVVIGPTILV